MTRARHEPLDVADTARDMAAKGHWAAAVVLNEFSVTVVATGRHADAADGVSHLLRKKEEAPERYPGLEDWDATDGDEPGDAP